MFSGPTVYVSNQGILGHLSLIVVELLNKHLSDTKPCFVFRLLIQSPDAVIIEALEAAIFPEKRRAAHSLFNQFSKIEGWLQGSTVCSPAKTGPIYVLTLEKCSTHQYSATHFIFVPFHLHSAKIKIQTLVVQN